jgi:hypothetical protein
MNTNTAERAALCKLYLVLYHVPLNTNLPNITHIDENISHIDENISHTDEKQTMI